MKELSIEQKAKAYDEALEKARQLYAYPTTKPFISDLQDLFPELAESEDERIRKELIEQVVFIVPNNDEVDSEGNVLPTYQKRIDKYRTWLEKQGEQKSIWHNEDEEPQRGSLILLVMQSGTSIVAKIIEPNHIFNHGERWAYIDDLLEKKGGQKPTEWSEEDESLLQRTISLIKWAAHCTGTHKIINEECATELQDWLKSLKDRYTWKPSDEQMAVLNEVINYAANSELQHWSSFIYTLLKSLREQLKRLMEE